MTQIRQWFERFFRSMACTFFIHRFKTLAGALILFLLMISSLGQLKMDVTTEAFLHEDDPSLTNYLDFKEAFGSDDLIIIGVKTRDVFQLDFLNTFEKLHRELAQEIPHLDDITSMVNVRNTRGEDEALFVDDLLEKFPRDQAQAYAIRKIVDESRLYKNLIVSEDYTTASIVIKLSPFSSGSENRDALAGFDEDEGADRRIWLSPFESSKAVLKAREITDRFDAEGFRIYLSGSTVVDHFLRVTVSKDSRKFLGLAYLTVAFFLALIFRRISGVLISLTVVTFTLFSCFGLMALTGIPVKLPSQILPSFILAVSVGYSVHLLALFYNRAGKGDSAIDAVTYATGHSGFAVVMTAVTTAAGLFSFSTSEVAPVAEVGIFAGAGVFIAMIFTFLLIPPLLSFVPQPAALELLKKENTWLDRYLIRLAAFTTGYPVIIVIVALIAAGVACFGLFKFSFSHDPLRWLPVTDPIRISTEVLDQSLGGTVTMEVVIDTKMENGLYDPDFTSSLEKAANEIEVLDTGEVTAGKVWSIVEILKETNRALNGNRKAFYRLPETRDLTAQELFLFEGSGSDDLEDFTDSMFSKARISVKVPYIDAIVYDAYIRGVNEIIEKCFSGTDASVTGMIMIYSQVIINGIHSMGKSYIYAFVTISLLMIIVTGSFRIGILGMLPNILPIILTMGIAGWLGMRVNLFTMLVGNIAMGLAVDDTIHFIHNFKKYFARYKNAEQAVAATFLSAGRAIIITSVVLSVGFFIFMFSIMNHLKEFGILTGFAILLALGFNMVVSPAIMTLAYKKQQRQKELETANRCTSAPCRGLNQTPRLKGR